MPAPITNPAAARRLLADIAAQRVPFFLVGDSRMAYQGHGNWHGAYWAASQFCPIYGSGVQPCRTNVGGSHVQIGPGNLAEPADTIANYRWLAPSALRASLGSPPGGDIVGVVGNGTTTTVTTESNHLLVNGGVRITGVADAAVDGSRTITVTGDKTFTFSGTYNGALDLTPGTAEVLQLDVRAGWRHQHVYVPPGVSIVAGAARTMGVMFYRGSPTTPEAPAGHVRGCVDLNDALTFRLRYGTFASGSGAFKWQIRRDGSPFTDYALSPTINTNTGAVGMAVSTLTVAASPGRNLSMQVRPAKPGDQDIVGPALFYQWQCVQDNRTAGVAFTCGMAWGGRSTLAVLNFHTAAGTLNGAAVVADTFVEMTAPARALGQTPKACIRIEEGFNDRNDSDPSKAAFKANTLALIAFYRAAWALAGYAPGDLYIILSSPNTIDWDGDTLLAGYADAYAEIAQADGQVIAVDAKRGLWRTPPDDFSADDYSGGAAQNQLTHGTQVGYQWEELIFWSALATAGGLPQTQRRLVIV